jgi:hypothetical protein
LHEPATAELAVKPPEQADQNRTPAAVLVE